MPVNAKVLKRGLKCEILMREDYLYCVHVYGDGSTLLNTYEEALMLMEKIDGTQDSKEDE